MKEKEFEIKFKPPNQFTGEWSGMYVELHSNGPYIQCTNCGFMSDLCGHACNQYPLQGYYIAKVTWKKYGLD